MEPRDLLKKLHPNQFSDSKTIDKIECSREILSFTLSGLSEENKHFDFEDFIRKLLEREICPNLIDETGPAAGGDGKVDTETITNTFVAYAPYDNPKVTFTVISLVGGSVLLFKYKFVKRYGLFNGNRVEYMSKSL